MITPAWLIAGWLTMPQSPTAHCSAFWVKDALSPVPTLVTANHCRRPGSDLFWKPSHSSLERSALVPDADWLVAGRRDAMHQQLPYPDIATEMVWRRFAPKRNETLFAGGFTEGGPWFQARCIFKGYALFRRFKKDWHVQGVIECPDTQVSELGPGASGGPIWDEQKRLVGVLVGSGNEGYGARHWSFEPMWSPAAEWMLNGHHDLPYALPWDQGKQEDQQHRLHVLVENGIIKAYRLINQEGIAWSQDQLPETSWPNEF